MSGRDEGLRALVADLREHGRAILPVRLALPLLDAVGSQAVRLYLTGTKGMLGAMLLDE